MKILVTGASGFIGAHLVATLRDAGARVRAAGRRSPALPGVEWIDLPEVRQADWPSLCAGVDAVVHLAGIAHARGAEDERLRAVNQDGPISLATALAPGQHLIFMSSIRAVSGASSPVEITEATRPQPDCAYGAAKLGAESAILRLRPDACILRPTTVYGAGVKHNMRRLATLAQSPLPLPFADFEARRSYLSIENLCSAVAFLLHARAAGVFNVSDPDDASVRDLVSWRRDAIGAPRRLFKLPAATRSALEHLPGCGALMRLATQPLVARPLRLLSHGWRPVHACARDGVTHWARSEAQDRSLA